MAGTILLETKNLSKRFGGLKALDRFDFLVRHGEIVGLIGPNGSGKTTFFHVVTGILKAASGTVMFGERREVLTALPPHRITALGIARTFQRQRLFNQMTVLQNVLVGAHCRTCSGLFGSILRTPATRREQKVVQEKATRLLALFGERLLPRAQDPAWTLSYANRRRLEIARALAADPLLLLLDEPAAGMNPTETRELMRDILSIREQGITIVLIEHDMTVVRGICDQVVALDHGIKIAEGSFEEVRNHPSVIEAYLGRRAKHA
ncbi:MAG: ABC transporter ATP-binding protein [candidate division NC10 bacterium]|nr:ABC transporter ATP-binding protein [candidate division NC10 bacterium]